MDLLDWFFSFSTAHNFSLSNEVIYDNLLKGNRVLSCCTFPLHIQQEGAADGDGSDKKGDDGKGNGAGNEGAGRRR